MSNPLFPFGYAGQAKTIYESWATSTVARLNSEARRRFTALQLHLLEHEGVLLGYGTGWRVQPPGLPGHASPGNSWHEGVPVSSKVNAIAIDTVGLPTHEKAWAAMERWLPHFGLVSFMSPAIPGNVNYTGVPYHGNWDRPHVQLVDEPYGRSFATSFPRPIAHWLIDPRYDVDFIVDLQNDPLVGAVPPPVTPPVDPSPPNPPVDPNPPIPPPGVTVIQLAGTKRVLRPEDRAALSADPEGKNDVQLVQILCNGLLASGLAIDGDYGPKTQTAVATYQSFAGVKADSLVGPVSWTVFLNLT